ncbi:MAG: hypothetical protein J6Y19_07020 [Kiritimatiellae bacterium]|nr:hypothetical protein [Kiritimatiellia bacterium]
MSTSLTDPQLVFAANKALIAAAPAIAKVKNFATDFSQEAAQPGDTLTIEVFDSAAATQYDESSNNYGTTNGSVTGVQVTFAYHPKKTYSYNPLDTLKVNKAIWNRRGEASGLAISRSIEASVAALINKTNIPKTGTGSAANESVLASITKANLAKLRAKIDAAGADPARTVLALNPDHFADMLALFDANVFGGVEAIRLGVVPGLYGFKAVMQLPLSLDAGEKLVGALIPEDALVVAGRTIPADDLPGAQYGVTVDEDSGLAVSTYAYVEHSTRKHLFTNEALFGAKVIQPKACVRLVSEATA